MHNLAQAYRFGKGVKVDIPAANRWLETAAQNGHPEAQTTVGLAKLKGIEGFSQDQGDAVIWLAKASEQGHAEAQFQLAKCYATGEGVHRNSTFVERLLLKSSRQGHRGAKDMLDKGREAGILRPDIPRNKPMNAPEDDAKGLKTPVTYSDGYDPTQACSQAKDKVECLRLKNLGT